jgi:hypothetical protein
MRKSQSVFLWPQANDIKIARQLAKVVQAKGLDIFIDKEKHFSKGTALNSFGWLSSRLLSWKI